MIKGLSPAWDGVSTLSRRPELRPSKVYVKTRHGCLTSPIQTVEGALALGVCRKQPFCPIRVTD